MREESRPNLASSREEGETRVKYIDAIINSSAMVCTEKGGCGPKS